MSKSTIGPAGAGGRIVILWGLSFCRRWISYWNVFEAILAIGSIGTIFPPAGSTRASVSRPFGFVRILRVVRYVRGLRTVVSTLGLAGTAMVTILTTIGIVIFAYAGPYLPSEWTVSRTPCLLGFPVA